MESSRSGPRGWVDRHGDAQFGDPPPGYWMAADHRWYPPGFDFEDSQGQAEPEPPFWTLPYEPLPETTRSRWWVAATTLGLLVIAGVALAVAWPVFVDDDGDSSAASSAATIESVDAGGVQCSDDPDREADGLATVWLVPAAEADLVTQVASILEAEVGPQAFTYVDPDETHRQFEDYFSGHPMTDNVGPQDLPTSFLVEFSTVGAAHGVADILEPIPGVDKVFLPFASTRCVDDLVPPQSCGQSAAGSRPATIEVWLLKVTSDGADAEAAEQVIDVLAGSPVVDSFEYHGFDEALAEMGVGTLGDPALEHQIRAEIGRNGVVTSFTAAIVEGPVDGRFEELRDGLNTIGQDVLIIGLPEQAGAPCES